MRSIPPRRASLGTPHCPRCGRPISSQTPDQIAQALLQEGAGRKCLVLAPLVQDRKGEYRKELLELRKAGFVRVRIDGAMRELAEDIALAKNIKHTIEVILDRLVIRQGIAGRVADSLEVAFKYGTEVAKVEVLDEGAAITEEMLFSQRYACVDCGISYPELTPRMFSFNNPHGACATCSGLGTATYFDPDLIVPIDHLSLNQGAIAPWERKAVET